jgi:hypothetical protein
MLIFFFGDHFELFLIVKEKHSGCGTFFPQIAKAEKINPVF